MKKSTEPNDELRPEYDMKSLLEGGVRGKYAKQYRAGTNLVLLEPDIAKAFPNENIAVLTGASSDIIFEQAKKEIDKVLQIKTVA